MGGIGAEVPAVVDSRWGAVALPGCATCGTPPLPEDVFCVGCGSPCPGHQDGRQHPPSWCAGRFELLGMLGRGSSAAVYLARDRRLDRQVALKAPRATLYDPRAVERLQSEVETLRHIHHPGVVKVHELVHHQGRCLAVLEHVEGATLRQVLCGAGRLQPWQIWTLLEGAVTGLAHVHRVGIVHGDVKPENVLVTVAGWSKLADFGQSVSRRTSSHGGSPGYLSPEARAGDLVDERSDVYSLGAVVWECLAGRPPEGQGRESQNQKVMRALRRSGVHRAWRSLVARSLALDPAERPDDAQAFLDQLRSAAQQAARAERWSSGIWTVGLLAVLVTGIVVRVEGLVGAAVVGGGALAAGGLATARGLWQWAGARALPGRATSTG